MAKIAILGYGTVGSGVFEVITRNNDIVSKNAKEKVEIKYVLDLRDFPGDPVEKVLTHNFEDIVSDSEVEVVVEVMGGTKPAYDFVKRSLQAGKSVCSSNKELVEAHGAELMAIAKENSVNFLFEASVGGGIPIIRPLRTSITADRILSISGILNGTTNYMLTNMSSGTLKYEEALKNAQDKGYAEKDPTADVEGFDACRKIAILSSIATGKNVSFDDIPTTGISKITKTDMKYVNATGGSIKLIAKAVLDENGAWARVAPVIISKENPLSTVNKVFNAILVEGDMLGETMYYGKGAGKLATAAAVVSDVVENILLKNNNVGCLWSEEKMQLESLDDIEVQKLVRIKVNDIEKAEEAVCDIFGVDEFITVKDGETAFITKKEKEALIKEKLEKLSNEAAVKQVRTTILYEA
ncbi:MAG: homoserine dehydrogenase [Firmicutes bacterium]|nr:homoserine dehydrogenase [Bacillota bacterium]